jgi:hypothetical protein
MEKQRLRVFQNRVLRRIFGPKRDEVAGSWIKEHEMRGARSIHGRDEKYIQNFGRET